jgi:hypothetical protein
MRWSMSKCDAALNQLGSLTIAQTIDRWGRGLLAEFFLVEDAAAWDGVSDFWATGGACRAPSDSSW